MMEIFTIGGGEYIVNVLNAVSAWTGGGGFRSLLRVVMVMGLIYSAADRRLQFELARVAQLVSRRDADVRRAHCSRRPP